MITHKFPLSAIVRASRCGRTVTATVAAHYGTQYILSDATTGERIPGYYAEPEMEYLSQFLERTAKVPREILPVLYEVHVGNVKIGPFVKRRTAEEAVLRIATARATAFCGVDITIREVTA